MESATLNLAELQAFAAVCAENLRGGEIIALVGDLGSGKTTFTKAMLKAYGVKKRITSPTFGIIAPYAVRNTALNHVDLYRINSSVEFKTLGIAQTWQQPDVIYIIEWADKIYNLLPRGTTIIYFAPTKDEKRKISITTK